MLDGLSKEDLQAIIDRIRAADRQEFETASGHSTKRGVSIAGLLEIPTWFLQLPLKVKVIASPLLLVHVSYELLHMFFVGFYQKPMAYEWFQAGGIHIRDPQRVEHVMALALREVPAVHRGTWQGFLWSIRFFLAKTVILKSTFNFSARRLHMALLHTALVSALGSGAGWTNLLGWNKTLSIAALHITGAAISGYAVLTIFLMALALNLGPMLQNYVGAFASVDPTINAFSEGWTRSARAEDAGASRA